MSPKVSRRMSLRVMMPMVDSVFVQHHCQVQLVLLEFLEDVVERGVLGDKDGLGGDLLQLQNFEILCSSAASSEVGIDDAGDIVQFAPVNRDFGKFLFSRMIFFNSRDGRCFP